jgi:hypothetical protein
MRFLMNTLPAPISTAIDSCVSPNLSGCARPLAVVFVSSAKPASRHPGLLAGHNYSSRSFGHQFNPASAKPLLRQHTLPKSLIALLCTPSLGTFPIP